MLSNWGSKGPQVQPDAKAENPYTASNLSHKNPKKGLILEDQIDGFQAGHRWAEKPHRWRALRHSARPKSASAHEAGPVEGAHEAGPVEGALSNS